MGSDYWHLLNLNQFIQAIISYTTDRGWYIMIQRYEESERKKERGRERVGKES